MIWDLTEPLETFQYYVSRLVIKGLSVTIESEKHPMILIAEDGCAFTTFKIEDIGTNCYIIATSFAISLAKSV